IESPEMDFLEYEVLNSSGCIVQEETANLNFSLRNAGAATSPAVQARLICWNDQVEIVTESSSYDAIGIGETGINTTSFSVLADNNLISGETVQFQLVLENEEQILQNLYFEIPVGRIDENCASLCDYGYIAVESGDSGNFDVPQYDWLEIDPNLGGSGTLITASHSTPDGFSSMVLLPFLFGYFGKYYDEISICSEGYILMGECDEIFFRNRPIPSGVGASAMIAPFWDAIEDGEVYFYFDTENHLFVVEWSDWRNSFDNSKVCTFEVILYDPDYYSTFGMGSDIKFQYKEITNCDSEENYATIGIENQDQTEGLQLTFSNIDSPTFHGVANESAIQFSIKSGLTLPYLSLSPLSIEVNAYEDTIIVQTITMQNVTSYSDALDFTLSFSHFNQNGERSLNLNRNIVNDRILQLTGYYVPVEPQNMPFYLMHNSPDAEPIQGIRLSFPDGCIVNSAQDIQSLEWNGETGNGAEVTWGFDGVNTINPATAVSFIINIRVDDNFPSPMNIEWYIEGDGSGAAPHSVSGTISLPATTDEIFWISYPNGGEEVLPAIQDTIRWDHFGDADSVKILLSRDDGTSWETITEGTPDLEYYPYIFEGPNANQCLIKVGSTDLEFYDVSDSVFAITSLNITHPDEYSIMSYATTDSIIWQDVAGVETVEVELSMDNGFTWTTLANDAPNVGKFYFTVPGPPSDHCRVRISNAEHNVENTSPFFEIVDSPVAWLSADVYAGTISPESSRNVQISFSTAGLDWGTYTANLRFETSIGQVLYVPVTLTYEAFVPSIETVKLYQNAPNPFNPFTRIDYDIPADCYVKLTVYNLLGQKVRTLVNEEKASGSHYEIWDSKNDDGNQVGSGIYFYLLKAGSKTKAKKMLLLK
ncbi:MAG TPA: T9SS type A sorting domain-containing protein, partial [Candidatus Cloacimonadota bacterium]|nr:T9SS type A sorting domain-containing protein [Candidatus Cloacimonadota bacterium]